MRDSKQPKLKHTVESFVMKTSRTPQTAHSRLPRTHLKRPGAMILVTTSSSAVTPSSVMLLAVTNS